MLEQDLRALNSRIDSLIQKVQALNTENHTLKQASNDTHQLQAKFEAMASAYQLLQNKEAVWQAERQKLLAEKDELTRKNDHARARVEAIILRLQALESPES